MKTLIASVLLVASFSASAQLYPNVINWGSSVQVQIHNSTQSTYSCSGNVYMHTQNTTESAYYFDFIPAYGSSFRSFYPLNHQTQIRFVSHSIFCNKAN